jgi:hypothetical protein
LEGQILFIIEIHTFEILNGAGNGNRTRLLSLGRTRSTTKPYPHVLDKKYTSSITNLPLYIKHLAGYHPVIYGRITLTCDLARIN